MPSRTIDRHSTPPLSPSTSLNSSAASSASSSCVSSQRGSLSHLSATRPDLQHLEHHNLAEEKLCFMPNRLEEDVVMLDHWQPEEEDDDEDENQIHGIHGERILRIIFTKVATPYPATHLMRLWVGLTVSGG
jgi:hypothetical protein